MNSFFNPDHWFWRGFGRLADYFILGFCWLLSSIPLITLGASTIALYDAVAHCVRGGEPDMVKRYISTFRKELVRGIFLTLLWTVLCLLLNIGYQVILQLSDGNTGWTIFSVVYFVTLVVPLGILCWLVAIESRFTYGFKELHTTAIAFTFGHLPSTLAIVAILVVGVNILRIFPFFIMCLPPVLAHLQSLFIEKVFRKYIPEEA